MQYGWKHVKGWLDENPGRKVVAYIALFTAAATMLALTERMFENRSRYERIRSRYERINADRLNIAPEPVRYYDMSQIKDSATLDYVKSAAGMPEIRYAGLVDAGNGRKDIFALASEDGLNFSAYMIDRVTNRKRLLREMMHIASHTAEGRFDGSNTAVAKAADLTGDGVPEVLYKDGGFDMHFYTYPSLYIFSDKIGGVQISGNTEIFSVRGGLPGVFSDDGCYFMRWDGRKFGYDAVLTEGMRAAVDLMISAASSGDYEKKMRVSKEIEKLYSDEMISICKTAMMSRFSPWYGAGYEGIVSLPLPEMLGAAFVQGLARQYQRYEEQKKEAELIEYYGGNPRYHVLTRDVNGNVTGLRERQDYTPNDYERMQQFHQNTEQGLNRFRDYSSEKARQYRQDAGDAVRDFQRNAQRDFQNFQRDAGRTMENANRSLENAKRDVGKSLENAGRNLENFLKGKK